MHKLIPWLILTTAALSVIFLGGKRRAFGIFVAQLRTEFNDTSLAELNWIGDSYAALGYLSTSITTSIILSYGKKFYLSQLIGSIFILLACITSAYVPNPHWLFITHTLLHGIGSSLILSTSGLVVNEHFDKNHQYHILATTLVSGGSVASILFVEFYAFLIEIYGWRYTFIILGIIYFITLSSGSFVFRKNPNKIESNHRNYNYFTNLKNIQSHQFILLTLWTIDRIITSIVTYGMLLNLADYMYRHETSLRKSALLTTLFAAGEASTYLIATLISALTKTFFKNRLRYILVITSFGMSIGLILWELLSNNGNNDYYYLSLFLAYFTGFCLGPSVTFLFPAGEELTQLPGFMAYPFSLSGMGIGMSLSPLVSALIAQHFQYRWFFLVQGFIMLVKSIALICSTMLLRVMRTKSDQITLSNGNDLSNTNNLDSNQSKIVQSNIVIESDEFINSEYIEVTSDEERCLINTDLKFDKSEIA